MADHPEDRCGRCGGRNVVWNVDSDRYNTAVNRSEIVCPTCFVIAHEAATGMSTVWQLTPMCPFRWIDPEGRPTPFTQRLRDELLAATTRGEPTMTTATLARPLGARIEDHLRENGWIRLNEAWCKGPHRLAFWDAAKKQVADEADAVIAGSAVPGWTGKADAGIVLGPSDAYSDD